MNELQNLFLGANVAVIVRDENEFNKLKEWMAEKNLFLANKEPVNKMQYPGARVGIYRNVEDLAVYWSPVNDLAGLGYKSSDLMNFLFSEMVIETEAKVIDEVSNIDLDISITEVVPATITSNIKELKEVTIPKIKQYAKTVVTAENYKDIDTMLTNLKKAKETLNKGKVATKKEASKTIAEFETDVKDILFVFDEVIGHLAEQTNAFKNAEKEKRRKEIQKDIDDTVAEGIERGELTQEYANKFKFDETWLNKTMSRTKVNKEIMTQIKELAKEYKRDKNDLDAIVGTINSQNVPGALMSQDKYIRLYQTGVTLPEVLKIITNDGISIREGIEKEKAKAVEDARETIVQETVNNMEQSVAILKEDTVIDQQTLTNHIDDKTGEVIAKSDEDKIIMKIQENKNSEKVYKYIYEFEGNFSAIKTFNNFLKVLSKINKTFKRREIKVKETPVLISKDKEGNYVIEEIKKEGNK